MYLQSKNQKKKRHAVSLRLDMTEVEEERQWQQFHKAQMLKFSVQCKNAE
jgi:hypothetical protein